MKVGESETGLTYDYTEYFQMSQHAFISTLRNPDPIIFMLDLFEDTLENLVSNGRKRREVQNNTRSLYYMRLRSADSNDNTADWSNALSLSYLNPDSFKDPVVSKQVILSDIHISTS